MDHLRIEDENIAELYATGRLSSEDEEAYEIHLLECRKCREAVSFADDFRHSIQTVAAEEAVRTATRAGLLVWLARRSHLVRIGVTALLLVLAALPAWLILDRSNLRRALEEARVSQPARPEQVAAQSPAPAPPAVSPAGSPATPENGAEIARLEQELSREREAREGLAGRIAELTRPQINTALYSLGIVRGSDAGEIELGPQPEWVVLSMELPAAEYESYRVTLVNGDGATVWKGDGLLPTASDTLNVLVYSDLLKPGEHRLQLEGVHADRAVPAGEIAFRVK